MATLRKPDASGRGVDNGYRVLLQDAKDLEIFLNDGRGNALFPDTAGKSHALYKVGSCGIEIFKPPLFPSAVLTVSDSALPDKVIVSFNRSAGAVEITNLRTAETKRFRNVFRIEIDSARIRADGEEIPADGEAPSDAPKEAERVCADAPEEAERVCADAPEEAERVCADAPEEAERVCADADTRRMEGELSRVRDALINAQEALSSERAAHERTERALSAEKVAHERTERALSAEKVALTAAREDWSRERAAHEKTQEALSGKTAETEELKRALENSAAALELAALDCGQVRLTLDALRERKLLDEDTLELMRAEPFLKGNSVLKTLESVERELDAAENRLGLIIRLRERINDAVQRAILTGDGTIPWSEELGGNRNGGDRPASGQSPADGTGVERGAKPSGARAAGD